MKQLPQIACFIFIFFLMLPKSGAGVAYRPGGSNSVQQDYNHALLLMGKGDFAGSAAKLKQIVQQHPDFLPAYEKLVFFSQQQDDLASVQNYLKKLLDSDSTSAGALFGMGYFYKTRQEYSNAIAYLKKSIRQNDGHYLAFFHLSDCYKAINKFDEGERYYQNLLKRASSSGAGHLGFGFLMQLKNSWKGALHYYDQAIQLDPSLTAAYRLKALVLFYSGRLKESYALSQQALQLSLKKQQVEEQAKIYQMLGTCLNLQGKLSFVIGHYKKAAGIFKQIGLTDAQYKMKSNLGIIYNRMGNYALAYQISKDCYSYFKDRNDSLQMSISLGQIGWVFMNQANYDSALGLIHYNQGEFLPSLDHFQQALRFAKEFKDTAELARVLTSIGRIFFDIGRIDSAMHYYERALKLHRLCGDRIFEAHTLANMANAAVFAGNFSQGLDAGKLAGRYRRRP